MSAVDIIGLLVPATFILFWVIELIWPAREFPARKGWALLGLVFFIIMATLSSIVPLLIPEPWLVEHRLMDGTELGIVGGTIVGYIVLSFIAYLWHRNVHRFDLLWRLFHQIHHAPQRVDMKGAVIFHPFEIIIFTLLNITATVIILGLNPVAAALVGYVAAFYAFFQHANINTPQWLGYFIQRPESHCVHHQREVHNYNYADLPVWDIIFGTFRNPKSWQGEAGFEEYPSKRLISMLLCKDVNKDFYGAGSLGSKLNINEPTPELLAK